MREMPVIMIYCKKQSAAKEIHVLKAINKAITIFCHKHSKFGIPGLMKYIVFISAAVYIIFMMDTTMTLLQLLAFHPALIMRGQIWRLFTWLFIPIRSNIFFTAVMLYFYFLAGSTLESIWGTARFNIFYISGILLNLVYGFASGFVPGAVPYLTPEFINLSMFFAYAVIFPDRQIMLFFIIPVKIKWLALLDAVFFAYSIITGLIFGNPIAALLPIVAILNFIIICGQDALRLLKPLKSRRSPQAVNFKRAARQARRERANEQYRHKCSVCGKTDAGYPNLEFRYCSRCEGYHCFCSEHINSHVHFK